MLLDTTFSIFLISRDHIVTEGGNLLLIDPRSDVTFNNGQHALTWRRYGQDTPHTDVAELLGTVNTFENLTAFAGEFILPKLYTLHPELLIIEEVTIQAVMGMMEMIETEQSASDAWQYRHSPEYYQRIADHRLHAHPLRSWERELLNSGGTNEL